MKITRVFDFIYFQKENYALSHALTAKINGEWTGISTDEVISQAYAIAGGLIEQGIKPGDKVAIISENRPEWCLADLGIQFAGAVSVPMYPTISADDYAYIFEHSEAKLVFVSTEEIYQKAKDGSANLPPIKIYSFNKDTSTTHYTDILETSGKHNAAIEEHKAATKPEDLLTIIYTSGTTGRPKGVMLTHNNIVSNALAASERSPVPRGTSRALSFLPLCHIYERTGLYFFTYMGVSIYFAESMDAIAENIKEVKPHTFNTVPRLLEKIYDKIAAKGRTLPGPLKALFFWSLKLANDFDPNNQLAGMDKLKFGIANGLIFKKWREALGGEILAINSGAAALQPRLAKVFWAAGIKVCEGYGLTETSPVISATIPSYEGVRVGYVGKPVSGVEVKIAEDGEVLCKGPNVMVGYYKNPELTAEVLKDGWFHTGDIGELTADNYLRITDRKKEMFKTSGGKYIAPQVMENKFKESYLIEQLMVVGEGKKFPAALISPNFEALEEWCKEEDIKAASAEEIINHPKVREKFAEEVAKYNQSFGKWEQIKKFEILPVSWGIATEELTPTLKLKRRIIKEKFAHYIDKLYEEAVY